MVAAASVQDAADQAVDREWPEVLTRQQAADFAQIHIRHLDTLTQQPGFPVRRLGRSVRIPRDAFLRWLEGAS